VSKTGSIAIVLDLDNTLVHSRIDFQRMRQRVIEVISNAGIPLPDEQQLASLAIAEIIDLAVQRQALATVLAEIWDAVTDEETRGMKLASVEVDAAEALRSLKSAGVTLALLTNNARAAALTALERFSLREPLDLVLARDDVTALKPSPAGLRLALERLPPVRRMAMVGDASIDGLAANRAGIPFIAFRPMEADLDRRGVVRWATIQALSELPALLTALRQH
jgi:phosphoglycolate phosphatase